MHTALTQQLYTLCSVGIHSYTPVLVLSVYYTNLLSVLTAAAKRLGRIVLLHCASHLPPQRAAWPLSSLMVVQSSTARQHDEEDNTTGGQDDAA